MQYAFAIIASAAFVLTIIVLGLRVNKLSDHLRQVREKNSDLRNSSQTVTDELAKLRLEKDTLEGQVKARQAITDGYVDVISNFQAFRSRVLVALGWPPMLDTSYDDIVNEIESRVALLKDQHRVANSVMAVIKDIRHWLSVPQGASVVVAVADLACERDRLWEDLMLAKNEVAALTLEKDNTEKAFKTASEIVYQLEKAIPEEARAELPLEELPKLVAGLIEENVRLSAALCNSQPRDPKTGRMVPRSHG